MASGPAQSTSLTVRWLPSALRSYFQTIARVRDQDVFTASMMAQRVERASAVLLLQPEIGTLTPRAGTRRFAIPRTGHTIEYRVVGNELRITSWARQTRRPRR